VLLAVTRRLSIEVDEVPVLVIFVAVVASAASTLDDDVETFWLDT
jgi:hypothetical protein